MKEWHQKRKKITIAGRSEKAHNHTPLIIPLSKLKTMIDSGEKIREIKEKI
jgi:hypothetical protein